MKFYYGELSLEIPESIYYPAEDSELLAKALDEINLEGKEVLEIGCGSGFLSIIMARKGAYVTAVDINPEAVEITKINSEENGADVKCFESDIFGSVKESFDVIVFNPPYLPVEEGEDDKTYAGGPSGRDTVEKFVGSVKEHLRENGAVFLLISSLTGENETIELFRKQGMTTESVAREKVPWEELIVIKAF